MYGRDHQNIVRQLSSNKKKKRKEICLPMQEMQVRSLAGETKIPHAGQPESLCAEAKI